jgi:hypothetical protein
MSTTNSSNPFEMFGEDKKPEMKLFSDELSRLKGKCLELYIGDQCETMNYDEISVPQNSSIFGTLVDVFDRFIILQCLFIRNGEIKTGNKIYINAFQIRAMTVLDGTGSLKDIFLNAKDAESIRNIIKQQGA